MTRILFLSQFETVNVLVTLFFVFSAIVFTADAAPPQSSDGLRLEVDNIGKQKIMMNSGREGLACFPDEGISVLYHKPLTFLLVAGDSTYLMQGTSWDTASPLRKVLEPSANGPDNGYAGIGAVNIDLKKKIVYAFYHAEDHEGYKKLAYNGVQNFMSSICLAVGSLDNLQFQRQGEILTTHHTKNTGASQPQGVADVTVSRSSDEKYLYAWYSDHSRDNNRGVQICMARSPISERGNPGTWKKWYEGDFREPGLGGRETPVLSLSNEGSDAWAPYVKYVPECRCYLMVFNAHVYNDSKPRANVAGGIRLAFSVDGISWSKPTSLVTAFGQPMPGKECAIHPSFVVNKATNKSIEVDLLYGYSPKWGHVPPAVPHHLAGRTVRLIVEGNSNSSDRKAKNEKQKANPLAILERLKGTSWVNSNNVKFEWTKDGRFLHKSIEKPCREVDTLKVEIDFGGDHRDTLVFDDDLTKFEQFSTRSPKNRPLFTGKRRK